MTKDRMFKMMNEADADLQSLLRNSSQLGAYDRLEGSATFPENWLPFLKKACKEIPPERFHSVSFAFTSTESYTGDPLAKKLAEIKGGTASQHFIIYGIVSRYSQLIPEHKLAIYLERGVEKGKWHVLIFEPSGQVPNFARVAAMVVGYLGDDLVRIVTLDHKMHHTQHGCGVFALDALRFIAQSKLNLATLTLSVSEAPAKDSMQAQLINLQQKGRHYFPSIGGAMTVERFSCYVKWASAWGFQPVTVLGFLGELNNLRKPDRELLQNLLSDKIVFVGADNTPNELMGLFYNAQMSTAKMPSVIALEPVNFFHGSKAPDQFRTLQQHVGKAVDSKAPEERCNFQVIRSAIAQLSQTQTVIGEMPDEEFDKIVAANPSKLVKSGLLIAPLNLVRILAILLSIYTLCQSLLAALSGRLRTRASTLRLKTIFE